MSFMRRSVKKMDKIDEETETISNSGLKETSGHLDDDFSENDILYTIEMLQAELHDVVGDVRELKKNIQVIEKDTESIRQRLHECSKFVELDVEKDQDNCWFIAVDCVRKRSSTGQPINIFRCLRIWRSKKYWQSREKSSINSRTELNADDFDS